MVEAMAANRGSKSLPAHCEVELDIFSGMPNPRWILTKDEADSFVRQVAALPRTSARKLSGNLGYRGFIVHCAQEANPQVIRIQKGIVQIPDGAMTAYAQDVGYELQRWLLN